MKLIIDIPDHLYSVIKNKECTHRNVLTEAIYDGIPLDKIMAEIEERETYEGIYLDRADVLQIIDKYREGDKE